MFVLLIDKFEDMIKLILCIRYGTAIIPALRSVSTKQRSFDGMRQTNVFAICTGAIIIRTTVSEQGGEFWYFITIGDVHDRWGRCERFDHVV